MGFHKQTNILLKISYKLKAQKIVLQDMYKQKSSIYIYQEATHLNGRLLAWQIHNPEILEADNTICILLTRLFLALTGGHPQEESIPKVSGFDMFLSRMTITIMKITAY